MSNPDFYRFLETVEAAMRFGDLQEAMQTADQIERIFGLRAFAWEYLPCLKIDHRKRLGENVWE